MTELLLQGKEFGPVMFLVCLFIGACYKLIKNHESRMDSKDKIHREERDQWRVDSKEIHEKTISAIDSLRETITHQNSRYRGDGK